MVQKIQGFTLLELIIAITIISVGIALAAPNIAEIRNVSDVKQEVRNLKNIFVLSRMEAIKRNCSLTLIFTQDGYQVFIDTDGSCELDPAHEKTLWEHRLSRVHFDTNKSDGDGLTFIENDNGHPCLRWDNQGRPHRNSLGFGAGTAYLCNSSSHYCVIVSKTGQIRIDRYTP